MENFFWTERLTVSEHDFSNGVHLYTKVTDRPSAPARCKLWCFSFPHLTPQTSVIYCHQCPIPGISIRGLYIIPVPKELTGHLEGAEKCYMRVMYLCIHSTDMHEYLSPVAIVMETVLRAGLRVCLGSKKDLARVLPWDVRANPLILCVWFF